MKCPFRTIRKVEYTTLRDSTTTEIFADCYEKECPFYYFNSIKKKWECRKETKYK
jgi:hypothetical protein